MTKMNARPVMFATLALSLAASLFSSPVLSQELKSEIETLTPTPDAGPSPIPLASIPSELAATLKMIRKQEAWVRSDTNVADIRKVFGERSTEFSLALSTLGKSGFGETSKGDLEEAERLLRTNIGDMSGWLSSLERTASSLERDLRRVREKGRIWRLSLDSAVDQEAPPEVLRSLHSTLDRVNGSEETLKKRRDDALVLQTQISDLRTEATDRLSLMVNELALRRKSTLKVDHVPLWHALRDPKVDRAIFLQTVNTTRRDWEEVPDYLRDRPQRIVAQVLLGLALLFLVWYLKNYSVSKTDGHEDALNVLSVMMQRPMATAVLLSTVLTEPLYPNAPDAWLKFLSFLMVFALVRLLPGLLPEGLRRIPFLLAGLFILHSLSIIVPTGNLLNSLLLIALTIATTFSMYWAVRGAKHIRTTSPSGWLGLLQLACGAWALLAFFSMCLAVIGDTSSAFHLTEGILTSAFSALILWAVVGLLRALTVISLKTKAARKLKMVLGDSQSICDGCTKIFQLAAVGAWGVSTLKGFGALGETTAWLNRFFHFEMEFGNISLTPWNLLYFVLAIWLSFQVSRLLRFVFEKDIVPRTSLPQGVPQTISKALHYGTVLFGVFVALSAIGIDGSNLALIVGALGFGISFGLQNVVNNFVSGLILLFERPIRVGDKIQIGDMGGIVGEIGIRATTVHTWDGADVIVPNANLISNDIVNWTFSDHKRRIDINVGVAYGIDPETVLALLPGLGAQHPDVLTDPEPVALFLGFGASSLDFSLRCWTKASAPEIHSDVGVAVNQALVEAGIEIPFPQQDLHLRSVDESIRKGFLSKG